MAIIDEFGRVTVANGGGEMRIRPEHIVFLEKRNVNWIHLVNGKSYIINDESAKKLKEIGL